MADANPDGLLSDVARLSRLGDHIRWNAVAFLAARGGPVAAMAVCAAILGPRDFGELMLLFLAAGSFHAVIEGGFCSVMIRSVSGDLDSRPSRAAANVRSGLLVAAAASAAAVGALAVATLRLGELPQGWLAATLLATAGAWSAVGSAVAAAGQRFRLLGATTGVGGAVGFAGCAAGVVAAGVPGALIGLALGHAVSALLTLRRVGGFGTGSRPGAGRPRVLWRRSAALLGEAGPAILTAALATPGIFLANMIVGDTSGLEQVGLFGVAFQWFSLLMFLPMVVTQVLLTQFSRDQAARPDDARRLLAGSTTALIAVVGLAGLLVGLAAPVVLGLYGEQYQDAKAALFILLAAAVVTAPQGSLSNFLISQRRHSLRLSINVAAFAVLLSAAWTWAAEGAVALAWAHLLSNAVRVGLSAAAVIGRRNG